MTTAGRVSSATDSIDPKLLLVAGFPRSGTTWLSNIFNAHPEVVYRHEPLARIDYLFDQVDYESLKDDDFLTKEQREGIVRWLVRAHPNTDRPPFFRKSHLWAPPWLQKILWLGVSSARFLTRGYEWAVRPRITDKTVLVLKETGWSIHLATVISGLQPEMTVFVIRHPCAVIASRLNGIRLNLCSPRCRAGERSGLAFTTTPSSFEGETSALIESRTLPRRSSWPSPGG